MDFNRFKAVFLDMLDLVLQHPADHNQKVVVGVISLVVGSWVFLKVCDKFDLPNVGMFTGVLYSVLGGSIMIGAMAAGLIWLPQYRKQLGDVTFYSALALAAGLGFYVPVLNQHIKGKFLGTLAAWSLAVAAALGVSMLVNTTYDMARDGQRAMQRGADRNATTREAIR